MRSRRTRGHSPLAWTLWHPHQKLWNWRLHGFARRAGRAIGAPGAFTAALIGTDSLILYATVLVRRVRRLGALAAFRATPYTATRVLYIDCGVHKQGEQVRFMSRQFAARCDLHILGFEASAEHHRDALAALADIASLDFRQVALVGPDHREPYVRLYKGPLSGKADSVHTRTERYEDVPAERLSEILRRDYAHELDTAAILLRMNIEGSEFDVIADLVDADLAARVDGYFGMWDDVAKIDPGRDEAFRRMLRATRISSITFNDRDLAHPLRCRAIALAIDTAIRASAARGDRVRSGPGPV